MTAAERILVGYIVAALLTMGVAFNLDYEIEGRGYEGKNAMRAAMCGLAWPIYASIKAFTFIRPDQGEQHG